MTLDAIRCSSSRPLQSLFPLLRKSGAPATILDPSVIFSYEQLELAAALAEKSRTDGTAVSERPEMEFLLWLACTPHANKAISSAGAKEEDDFVLVVLGESAKADAKMLAKKLGLIENKKKLGASSDAALSFFGVKTPEQLFEKMALSRL